MSSWKGIDGTWHTNSLPHSTKIIRKPDGVGCELKSLCDCDSGVMLKLEIVEAKEQMRALEYTDEYQHSTAQTMRLVKHYFGSWRTIIADSAFSSVSTAKALLSKGLHFIGCVKTAHKLFPKDEISQWSQSDDLQRGDHVVYTTSTNITYNSTHMEKELYAIGWNDKKMKQFIATRGVTTAGTPSIRERHRIVEVNGEKVTEKYQIEIPRPQVVELYYSNFSVIDIHDHFRQGSLAMEDYWKTKIWWHRIFSTIFGIIITDCYKALCYENNQNNNNNEEITHKFADCCNELCFQLIHNNEDIINTRNNEPNNENIPQINQVFK